MWLLCELLSSLCYLRGIKALINQRFKKKTLAQCCPIVWSDMRHSRLLNLFNRVYLKLNIPIQLSNPILKPNSQTQLPCGATPPAPCKERFLLTILSSRRIRLNPANGSHYAARKTIRPGATSIISIFYIAPGQGFALKAAE